MPIDLVAYRNPGRNPLGAPIERVAALQFVLSANNLKRDCSSAEAGRFRADLDSAWCTFGTDYDEALAVECAAMRLLETFNILRVRIANSRDFRSPDPEYHRLFRPALPIGTAIMFGPSFKCGAKSNADSVYRHQPRTEFFA